MSFSISYSLTIALQSFTQYFKVNLISVFVRQNTHGKVYYNDVEDAHRFRIWSAKQNDIEAHNVLFYRGQVSYSMKHSALTDRVGLIVCVFIFKIFF